METKKEEGLGKEETWRKNVKKDMPFSPFLFLFTAKMYFCPQLCYLGFTPGRHLGGFSSQLLYLLAMEDEYSQGLAQFTAILIALSCLINKRVDVYVGCGRRNCGWERERVTWES